MSNKVLIIGIDAMDPRIVNKLIDKLPNFKKLNFAKLQTTIPPETPVAWSAACTGCNPGKYGIFDFINRDLKTYKPRLNLATEKPGIIKSEYVCAMKGEPFWRVLSDNKIKTSVIRWPVTFPPEKITGRMLSGLGVVDIKGMLNSYSFYTDDTNLMEGEGKEKVVSVEIKEGIIDTYLSGPLIRKGGEIKDARIDMKIEVDDEKKEILVKIGEDKHVVKEKNWSDIIRAKFKLYLFAEAYGVFDFYLDSIKPFRMYMSSVQIDPCNQITNITYPKEYGKELVDNIGLFYTLGMTEDTKAVTEGKISTQVLFEQIKKIEEQREKMFWYEFDKENDCFAFVFDAGDRLKHIFWKRQDLSGENIDVPKEIEEYYIEKDKFIGEVLEKIDENMKVIVMSDHGFGNFNKQVNINSWLVKEGYMKSSEELDLDSKENSLFNFVKWPETKAYSLGFTSVYLNLKSREGEGIVSDDEKDKLVDEIVMKLKELKDSDNKKNVFTNVYKGKEVYSGKHSSLSPDIVVGFNQGYRMSWKNAVGALDKEIISDNEEEWKGDHLIDRSHVPGVLFTNFKINKENPSIMDICPTVLGFFDLEGKEIDGESLI